LSARVDVSRKDELGRLDASFNAMAARIQAQANALENSRDELERQVDERTAELVSTARDLAERDVALRRAHAMARLGHVITRPDGSFERWSDTLPPLIGVAPADMPQSTREWMSLLNADDRVTFRNTSIAAGKDGLRKEVEYRLRRSDGQWVTLFQVIEPIPGTAGADGRMRWFSTMQDITERKRAETALQASEERTRLIVDTALDAVITMDAAGIITGWNPRAETTFGWSRAEALGRTLAQTIVPERYRTAHKQGLERYLATGDAKVLGRRIELSALHRDGREFDVDLSITPIRTDGSPSFSAFVRDITEQKLARERLHAQLERLTLLDQITRAIGERQDLQSIYQVAIRSLEERLPVDFGCVCRYDPIERALTVIRVGAHSQALALELAMGEECRIEIDQNGLSRCVRGEFVYEEDIRTVPFPFPQRLASGGLCALVAAPLRSESRVFGIVVIARREPHSFSSADCEFVRQLSAHVALAAQQAELHGALQQAYDDLRQTQQSVMQQERLRALGQMASGIAHDINNAISPVSLYTESLLEREPQLTARGRGYLVTIARAIDDVAATVARMREFYREREPQMLLKAVLLNPLVQQVVDLTEVRWRDMPQQRGAVIDVRTELDPDLPAVSGVDSEVREALTNLVFNAVDAMPDGGVLTLRTRSVVEPGVAVRRAVIEVADTGVGMDDDTRRRCLEPFFTTKGERGTGLGLAMVYGMAQRHAAEIGIDSAPGRGTTVSLSFPVPAIEPADAAEPAPRAPASRLRILIIDDDPLLLNSLRDSLELDGHSVITANGGEAGIDAFRAAPEDVDAVITDLGMPYVDGRRVAEAVKADSPTTPVILLTGWGQRLMSDGEMPRHVDRVLSKPPKLRELRAALAEGLRSASSTAVDDSIREKP
jgi:PAS domain S-box-containing protein